MKYLKRFEVVYTHYKVGDYIHVNGIVFSDEKQRPGKIIDIDDLGWYLVHFLDCSDKYVKNNEYYSHKQLTPEEIKDFEAKLKAKTYNL